MTSALALAGNYAAQEEVTDKPEQRQKITLQYRVKRDALMPSSFLAFRERGLSGPVKLIWNIPEADAQKKRQFDDLIKRLEENSINGVEFECQGEWLKPELNAAPGQFELPLRITGVPQLTESAQKRIKEMR